MSTDSGSPNAALSQARVAWIRHNIGWLQQLQLRDGERVACSPVTPGESDDPLEGPAPRVLQISPQRFARLAAQLLKKGPKPYPHCPHIWTVRPGVEATINRVAEHASLAPCGHVGVHNVRGEADPGFSCQHDDCEIRFDRETAREVWR